MNDIINNLGVVIPVWNRECILTQTLDSVLNQTRLPYQVVVVDDGSTDGTADVVAVWQKKKSPAFRFDYVFQKNAGVSVARNRGAEILENCSHVAFLDSDDMWPADFVESALKDFEVYGNEIVLWSRNHAKYDAQTGDLDPQYIKSFNDIYPAVKRAFYLNHLPILSGTVVRLRDHFAVNGFRAGMLTGQDRDWMLKMARGGKWVLTSGAPVYFRRDYQAIKRKNSDHLSHLNQQKAEWQIARPATHEFYLMEHLADSMLSHNECAGRLAELWKHAGREYLKKAHKQYGRWCYERAARIERKGPFLLLLGNYKLFGVKAQNPGGWLASRLLPDPVLPQ